MKYINYLVLLFSILTLSACSFAGIGDSNKDSDVLAEETGKIIWWGLYEEEKNLKPLIDKFVEENKGIEIEYIQKDEVTYYDDLASILQDGNVNNTPDIFMIHNSWVGNFEGFVSNAPESIYPYAGYENDFHKFVVSDFAKDKQVKGVPLWVDLLGLVYHKNLLMKDTGSTVVSDNWNDFLNQTVSMTKYSEDKKITRSGFSAGVSSNVEFSFEIFNLLMLQSRADDLTKEDLTLPYVKGQEKQVNDAMQFYRSFKNNTWNDTFKLDTAEFIEGDLASIILPSWRLYDILNYNESKNLGFDIGVSQIPQLKSESTKISFPTYWGYVVSKDSKKSNSSWKLLNFLSKKENQELYMKTVVDNGRPFALISPRKDLIEAQKETALLKPYIDSVANTYSWYMISGEKLRESGNKVVDGQNIEEFLKAYEDVKAKEDVL